MNYWKHPNNFNDTKGMNHLSTDKSKLFRITYEIYSKFANNINRCSTLLEIGDVCMLHLKYLINFRLIRMIFEQEDKFLLFEFTENKILFYSSKDEQLYDYEENLVSQEVPIKTEHIPLKLVKEKIDLTDLEEPVLWGWLFKNYQQKKAIVSLIADREKKFSSVDIEILKLVVDCIQSKIKEIYLKSQLSIQNQNLSDALATIKSKNNEIEKIVENQKKTIENGLSEIREKNKKLLHISALNSHQIREPLSRIQGLIHLFDLMDDKSCRKDLIPKLKSSIEEMDKVLQEVIEMATEELIKLKADNNE